MPGGYGMSQPKKNSSDGSSGYKRKPAKAPMKPAAPARRSPTKRGNVSMDQKMGNPRTAAAAMKKYEAEVSKRKAMYASSDRLNAAARAAGKNVKKSGRSMPTRPSRGRGY